MREAVKKVIYITAAMGDYGHMPRSARFDAPGVGCAVQLGEIIARKHGYEPIG